MKINQNQNFTSDPYEVLKPLEWDTSNSNKHFANGPGISYTIVKDNESIILFLFNRSKGVSTREDRFKTLKDAQSFVDKTHYPHYMSKYLKALWTHYES